MNKSKMRIELLVSTMNQKDTSLIDKMNISTDAIIINQYNHHDYTEVKKDNIRIRMFTFNEKGVGKSRNNALMRSSADICVLADDDVVYDKNYREIIESEFKKNPQADVIIFRVKIIDNKGERNRELKKKRVRFFNTFKYGAVRIAFRRKEVLKRNIHFTLLFGGGAKYGSGEDSIFLADCLKKGLKIWTSPQKIADVYNHQSSWFQGYNKKYFYDKGALFGAIGAKLSVILNLQFIIRHRKILNDNFNLLEAFKLMQQGSKDYKGNSEV